MTTAELEARKLVTNSDVRETAIVVARVLVVEGQSQYSALLAAEAETESDSFAELERWITEKPEGGFDTSRPRHAQVAHRSLPFNSPLTNAA